MGHSGSVNVGSEQTRHALLNRYHPTSRLAPAPDLEPEQMSTLERANSARYLRERFGVGRCSQPTSPPASFPLPPTGPQPITCSFFLHGLFQLWLIDEDDSLLRWFSDDLTTWTPAPAPDLPTAEAASAIVDLQYHHYELEGVLCVVYESGGCQLFQSLPDPSSPGGFWQHAVSIGSEAGIALARPFNA